VVRTRNAAWFGILVLAATLCPPRGSTAVAADALANTAAQVTAVRCGHLIGRTGSFTSATVRLLSSILR
jgi:hypothetical protein